MGVAGGVMEGRAATEDVELSMGVVGGVKVGKAVIVEDVVVMEPSSKGRGELVGTTPTATDSLIMNFVMKVLSEVVVDG